MEEESLVKQACKQLGITQSDLAERMGIHYTTIAKWGREIPKSSKVTIELMLENQALKARLERVSVAIKTLLELEKI